MRVNGEYTDERDEGLGTCHQRLYMYVCMVAVIDLLEGKLAIRRTKGRCRG